MSVNRRLGEAAHVDTGRTMQTTARPLLKDTASCSRGNLEVPGWIAAVMQRAMARRTRMRQEVAGHAASPGFGGAEQLEESRGAWHHHQRMAARDEPAGRCRASGCRPQTAELDDIPRTPSRDRMEDAAFANRIQRCSRVALKRVDLSSVGQTCGRTMNSASTSRMREPVEPANGAAGMTSPAAASKNAMNRP